MSRKRTPPNIQLINISHHRNGICGMPFHVVTFEDDEEKTKKVAVVFKEQSFCAVLDIAKLASGDIEFASNSYRGDYFEPALRKIIQEKYGDDE